MATQEENDEKYSESEGISKRGVLTAMIAAIVVSLVVAYVGINMMIMPSLVSKADFDKNLGSVSTDIASIKTSLAQIFAPDGLQSKVSTLQSNIGSISADISGVKSSMSGYATQNSINSLSTSLGTLQADLNSVKSNVGDIPSLKSQVSSLQSSIDSLKSQLSTLTDRVTAVESRSTTSSSSGGGSSSTTNYTSDTLNGVTVSIQSYSFFGNPTNPFMGYTNMNGMIPFTTADTGNDTAVMLQLVVQNDNTYAIKDLSISLGIGVVNQNGSLVNVTTNGVTLVSQAMIPQWASQFPTGVHNYLLFYGGSYAMFNFSQPTGDRDYLCTLTIPSSGGLSATTPYFLYPQIKIISFTKQ